MLALLEILALHALRRLVVHIWVVDPNVLAMTTHATPIRCVDKISVLGI
jgi:hypothetical protein